MGRKYKFKDEKGIYFTSTATVYWLDIFTRRVYKDIIIESLEYCCIKKGLILHGYVIMSNHIHLLCGKEEASDNGFSDIIRDFKKYTTMKLIKAISENPQESRREWLLWVLRRAGSKNGNNTRYQLWQQHNKPIELNGDMIEQKLNYIHDNPVEAGWVSEQFEFYYSSARNYTGMEGPIKITSVFDGEFI